MRHPCFPAAPARADQHTGRVNAPCSTMISTRSKPRASTSSARPTVAFARWQCRSEEHTSELQSLMRISYAVFCLKKKKENNEVQRSQKQTTKLTSPKSIDNTSIRIKITT